MKELFDNFCGYIRISAPKLLDIIPLSIILFIMLLFIYKKARRKVCKLDWAAVVSSYCFAVSLSIIFVMTLYGREIDYSKSNVVPQLFTSYKQMIWTGNTELLLQIIMNIVIFIPFGFCLPWNFSWFRQNKRVFLCAAALSGSIELIQGITGMGLFEIDDIVHNVLGTEIGVLLYFGLRKQYKKRGKRQSIRLSLN